MNEVIITGRLTRDPELRSTTNGTSVCSFTVACQRNYKNAEGNYDCDFVPCTAWRQTADHISRYFSKGSGIEIVGQLMSQTYENKEGKKVTRLEVSVKEVEFGKGSKLEKAEPKKDPTSLFPELEEVSPINDPDLPF